MKIQKEDIPVAMEGPGMIARSQSGYGGMTIAFNEFPAGTDVGPLLEGLEHDSCHCPHWGYILAGSMRVQYHDGKKETLQAGDVFYLPPGHIALVEEDLKMIEFSPDKEFGEVMAHVAKKMAELEA